MMCRLAALAEAADVLKVNRCPGKLFTFSGQRKYLTSEERQAFLAAARQQSRREVRSFCEVLAHTGCRISEALALTADSVDLAAQAITIRTLKQRGRIVFRAVPVPDALLDTLDLVHRVRKRRSSRSPAAKAPLWSWGRTQAYKHVVGVMQAAGIQGPHATPKGLRHGFGVKAAAATRNPRLVQKWLGHRHLNTSALYMDVQGEQERELAARMWD